MRVLVLLRVARSTYDDIRERIVAAGASDLIIPPICGAPERLNMGEIALEAEA